MRTIRTSTISILALGLLAGSAVGVAAQDEAAPNSEFTAEWGFRGGCCTVVEPASDPRFDGTVSSSWDEATYMFPDYSLRVASRALHVENDDGAWRGVPSVVTFHPDGTQSSTTQTFIGEGEYEGSYAVVDITTTPGIRAELRGFIFEGEPPGALTG